MAVIVQPRFGDDAATTAAAPIPQPIPLTTSVVTFVAAPQISTGSTPPPAEQGTHGYATSG